ncbi:MAG: hypothetical protein M0Z26_10470 [Acidithiobacillus sp.]|nr:hypothetical protein [Acidithiobacillus sp.]
MAQVSITKAAGLAGVSRSTFYRSYINTGKVSVGSDHQGNPVVDTSELLRVFGVLHDTTENQDTKGVREANDPNILVISELESELHRVRDILRIREEELHKAEERELWLRDLLARSQNQLRHEEKKDRPWWRLWG